MPTIFTHALVPLIAVAALPNLRLSKRLIVVGMAAAVLPDADVITGRLFHIPHTHDLGHRGATHTLAFAWLIAGLAMLRSDFLRAPPRTAALFVLAATLSHSLTDMLTAGGKGIMLFWPLEEERLKFLVHPIEASPVGLKAFETGVIWQVLISEALWLLLPSALVALFVRRVTKSSAAAQAAD